MLKTVAKVNEEYMKMHVGDKYASEVVNHYEVERTIEGAKRKLVSECIASVLKKKNVANVDVPSEVHEKFVKEKGFDEVKIEKFLVENYVAKADTIAHEQILKEAQKLLDTIWTLGMGSRLPRIDEFVRKEKMTLEVMWSIGSIDYRDMESIRAFEKIIAIVLDKQNPATAQPFGLANIIENARSTFDYGQVRSYLIDNKYVTECRIYKNGKFEVKFSKESYARKVGKALIS